MCQSKLFSLLRPAFFSQVTFRYVCAEAVGHVTCCIAQGWLINRTAATSVQLEFPFLATQTLDVNWDAFDSTHFGFGFRVM